MVMENYQSLEMSCKILHVNFIPLWGYQIFHKMVQIIRKVNISTGLVIKVIIICLFTSCNSILGKAISNQLLRTHFQHCTMDYFCCYSQQQYYGYYYIYLHFLQQQMPTKRIRSSNLYYDYKITMKNRINLYKTSIIFLVIKYNYNYFPFNFIVLKSTLTLKQGQS